MFSIDVLNKSLFQLSDMIVYQLFRILLFFLRDLLLLVVHKVSHLILKERKQYGAILISLYMTHALLHINQWWSKESRSLFLDDLWFVIRFVLVIQIDLHREITKRVDVIWVGCKILSHFLIRNRMVFFLLIAQGVVISFRNKFDTVLIEANTSYQTIIQSLIECRIIICLKNQETSVEERHHSCSITSSCSDLSST